MGGDGDEPQFHRSTQLHGYEGLQRPPSEGAERDGASGRGSQRRRHVGRQTGDRECYGISFYRRQHGCSRWGSYYSRH